MNLYGYMEADYLGLKIPVSDKVVKYWGSFTYGPSVYEPEKLRKLIGLLPKNATLFDVGASTGSYSLLPLVVPGLKVYSFEPCKKVYDVLVENLDLNNINPFSCFNVAVSDYDGDGYFDEMIDDWTAALSSLGGWDSDVQKKKVDVIKLDSFHVWPDVIKIDVEGSELLVVRGAEKTIKKKHPIIQVEYQQETCARFGYSREAIPDLLRSWGYEIEVFNNNEIFAT